MPGGLRGERIRVFLKPFPPPSVRNRALQCDFRDSRNIQSKLTRGRERLSIKRQGCLAFGKDVHRVPLKIIPYIYTALSYASTALRIQLQISQPTAQTYIAVTNRNRH